MTAAERFCSIRRAHLAAAGDRVRIANVAHRGSTLERQLADDVAWLLKEIQRLEMLVVTAGLSLDYGTSQLDGQ